MTTYCVIGIWTQNSVKQFSCCNHCWGLVLFFCFSYSAVVSALFVCSLLASQLWYLLGSILFSEVPTVVVRRFAIFLQSPSQKYIFDPSDLPLTESITTSINMLVSVLAPTDIKPCGEQSDLIFWVRLSDVAAYFIVLSDCKMITGFRLLSFCLLVFWRLKAISGCIHFSHFSFSAVK